MRNMVIGSLLTLTIISIILVVLYRLGVYGLKSPLIKDKSTYSRYIKVVERNSTITKFIFKDENLTSKR